MAFAVVRGQAIAGRGGKSFPMVTGLRRGVICQSPAATRKLPGRAIRLPTSCSRLPKRVVMEIAVAESGSECPACTLDVP